MNRLLVAMVLGGLCVIILSSVAKAQPAVRALWVQDRAVQEHVPWYRGPVHDGLGGLPFPPLERIRPVRMPDPAECIDDPAAPGRVLAHDAETGVTLELPGARVGPGGWLRGFRGFDGGGEDQGQGQRDFGCMLPVEDSAAFPYRMNAVAVMRYEDQFGQDLWTWCSAAMQDAEVALLAAHCVFDRAPTIMDYAKEVFIIPGWDGEGTKIPPDSVLDPYGWARGTYYLVATDWVVEGNYNYDMAAVVLTRATGMLTGWFGRAWDDPCPDVLSRPYYNRSYPGGCYDGTQMYKWGGFFDSCPSGNKLQINFVGDPPQCCNTTHGGMSGSNAYFEAEGELYVHAVNSHKTDTYARFIQMWTAFHNDLTSKTNDVARGEVLDIQPLDCNGPVAAMPGSVVVLNHLCTNPTNFDPPQQSYTFTWYLSANEDITTADTPLSTRVVQLNLSPLDVDPAGAMARVVTMPPVQIPANTPPGTYWLGVIYDAGTDGTPGNNAATTWDAHQIAIGQ